jgi:hypothetical protein
MPSTYWPRIALVRVDDVDAAPVPELHVHLAEAVLVVAGDDQAAALGSHLAGEIQRPLQADRLDRPLAPTPVGQPLDLVEDARVVVHDDGLGGARGARHFERERPARDGDDAGAGVHRELREQRAEEADADDGPVCPASMPLRPKMLTAQPSGSPAWPRLSSEAGSGTTALARRCRTRRGRGR